MVLFRELLGYSVLKINPGEIFLHIAINKFLDNT